MVSYEEAKEIALKQINEIGSASEFDIGYVFSNQGKDDPPQIGGFGSFAVLKNKGEIVNLTYFYMSLDPKFIRDIV